MKSSKISDIEIIPSKEILTDYNLKTNLASDIKPFPVSKVSYDQISSYEKLFSGHWSSNITFQETLFTFYLIALHNYWEINYSYLKPIGKDITQLLKIDAKSLKEFTQFLLNISSKKIEVKRIQINTSLQSETLKIEDPILVNVLLIAMKEKIKQEIPKKPPIGEKELNTRRALIASYFFNYLRKYSIPADLSKLIIGHLLACTNFLENESEYNKKFAKIKTTSAYGKTHNTFLTRRVHTILDNHSKSN